MRLSLEKTPLTFSKDLDLINIPVMVANAFMGDSCWVFAEVCALLSAILVLWGTPLILNIAI